MHYNKDPLLSYSLPEFIEYELKDDGLARCIAFNRRGTLLAIGCQDGRVSIWDFDIREMAKVLVGHVQVITSISWSRSGRHLLTTSLDGILKYWDLLTCEPVFSMLFSSPILSASLRPEKCGRSSSLHKKKEEISDTSDSSQLCPKCLVCTHDDDPTIVNLKTLEKVTIPRIQFPDEKKQVINTVGIFYGEGYIYTGDSRGIFAVYESNNYCCIEYEKIGNPIKAIIVSKDQQRILLNCGDKIRVYKVNCWKAPLFELTNAVNRSYWKSILFIMNDDYIIAASEGREHKIYKWINPRGSTIVKPTIETFVQGPKEGILDLAWHPIRPILISIGSSGKTYVWNSYVPEKWGTFSPGFVDLKRNEEYIEREDEFDIVEENCETNNESEIQDENEDVEILLPDELNSDEEEDDDIFYVSVNIIPDSYIPKGSSSPSSAAPEKSKKRKLI